MEKDLEESDHRLILRYYPGILLERLRKPRKTLPCYPVFRPRCEPATSQIQSNIINTRPRRSIVNCFEENVHEYFVFCRPLTERIVGRRVQACEWL